MKRLPHALTRTPKVRKSWQCAEDPQKAQVYLMEYFLIGAVVQTTTKRSLLKKVAEHACAAAGVAPPRVQFKDLKDKYYGYTNGEAVVLNCNAEKSGCNLQVLLHELAHWIADQHYGTEVAAHGREFVTVYRWLLDKYKCIPGYCFDLLCEENNVEVVDNDDAPAVFQV